MKIGDDGRIEGVPGAGEIRVVHIIAIWLSVLNLCPMLHPEKRAVVISCAAPVGLGTLILGGSEQIEGTEKVPSWVMLV